MNNNNRNFSPNEQLRIIQEMIEKTKKDSAENDWSMLLWGWLILTSCISVYIIHFAGYPELSWLPWPILMSLGGLTHFFIEMKKHKTQKVLSYAERSIGWIWISCGSAMFIIAFIAPASGILSYDAITTLIALIVGIGSLVTSKIVEWNYLTYCSLLWWICAILCMFTPPFYHNLFFGIVVIIAYLIPGYRIRNKYKKV